MGTGRSDVRHDDQGPVGQRAPDRCEPPSGPDPPVPAAADGVCSVWSGGGRGCTVGDAPSWGEPYFGHGQEHGEPPPSEAGGGVSLDQPSSGEVRLGRSRALMLNVSKNAPTGLIVGSTWLVTSAAHCTLPRLGMYALLWPRKQTHQSLLRRAGSHTQGGA